MDECANGKRFGVKNKRRLFFCAPAAVFSALVLALAGCMINGGNPADSGGAGGLRPALPVFVADDDVAGPDSAGAERELDGRLVLGADSAWLDCVANPDIADTCYGLIFIPDGGFAYIIKIEDNDTLYGGWGTWSTNEDTLTLETSFSGVEKAVYGVSEGGLETTVIEYDEEKEEWGKLADTAEIYKKTGGENAAVAEAWEIIRQDGDGGEGEDGGTGDEADGAGEAGDGEPPASMAKSRDGGRKYLKPVSSAGGASPISILGRARR
jgi:hypothetical protein